MTREEIRLKVSKADKEAVARRTKYSLRMVKAILLGQREDKRGVLQVFEEIIEAREAIANKIDTAE